MFHARERLPHLLPPNDYSSEEGYSKEIDTCFSRSWHFAALRSDLAKSGDFVTLTLLGQPIQVRNLDGTIYAVSNVCAHRHCLLTSEPKGSSPTIRCQYHGWEYAGTGESRKIPLAKHFAPLDRNSIRLHNFRVESVGPFVFVNLDPSAPGVAAFLGEALPFIEKGFGDGWEVMFAQVFDQSVNWKIPIENSLEAYHVPSIHADTFRTDPGEERSEHHSHATGSWFETTLPFAPHSSTDAFFQRWEGRLFQWLTGSAPTTRYQQHHIFPNILLSFTDMMSLMHVVEPTGPQSCRCRVFQFGRIGKSMLKGRMSRVWGSMASQITLKILKEDFGLYRDIQMGLNASRNEGMLGRCEERIHWFQKWIMEQSSRHGNSPASCVDQLECHQSSSPTAPENE